MAQYVSGLDRSQPMLLPASVDDYVSAENPVRVVEAFIDALDLNDLGFKTRNSDSLGPLPHSLSQFLPSCFLTAILVFGAPTAHAQIPQDGLVAHYSFQGDARSSTGNFDGTLEGGATFGSINGINGEYLLCDGDDDYVNISEGAPILDDFDSGWSASAWFRADAVPGAAVGDDRFIVFETSGDFTISLGLREGAPGKTNVQFLSNSSASAPNLVHSMDDADVNGKWIHATLTFENSGGIRTLRAYVNGTNVVTENVLGTLRNAEDGFHIGAHGDPASEDRFFKGGIDEVAIWERTLTDAEIEILAIPPIIVTTEADEGLGSLRQAIAESPEGGLIVFDPDLDGRTITLAGDQLTVPSTAEGLFIDASNLPNGLTIDANQQSRVMLIDRNATAALHGLTFTGGLTSEAGDGGGIFADSDSTLTLTACTVSGNQTSNGGIEVGDGGGIFAGSDSTLTLTACTVSGNQTGNGTSRGGDGGGISVGSGSTLTLAACIVSGNRTGEGFIVDGGFGGGISAGSDSTLTLTSCTVSGNQTGDGAVDGGFGGGISVDSRSTLTLTACTVNGNRTGDGGGSDGGFGGGIFADSRSTLTLTACTVSGNRTGDGGRFNGGFNNDGGDGGSGGGIFVDSDSGLTLTTCTVSGNQTGDGSDGGFNNSSGGGDGGFGGLGGGIFADSDSTFTLTGCTVSGNQTGFGGLGGSDNGSYSGIGGDGGDGGGIYYQGLTLEISHCTIVGNHANDRGRGGGILYVESGVILTGSIVADNVGLSGNDIGRSFSSAASVVTGSDSYVGDLDDWTRTGEPLSFSDGAINLAPLSDYGGPTQTMIPLPGSPAINNAPDSTRSTDQRGFPITDGFPDIGAAEFQGTSPTSVNIDIDHDGDGNTLGVEFALGTDPFVSDPGNPSNLNLSFDPAGTPIIDFGVNPAAIGIVTWILERSTDLETWNSSTPFFQSDNPTNSVPITDDTTGPAGPRTFYRFVAELR